MRSIKNPYINKGAVWLTIGFGLAFFLLFGRFVYIQITGEVDGQVLAEIADSKWEKTKGLEASRGTIFDRNGKPVATDTPSYTVFAILDKDYPTHVKNPRETAEELAPLLDMEVSEMEKRLREDEKFQVEFGANGRNINYSLKEKIESLDLSGIGFRRETNRYYPNGKFASHLLGFANRTEDGVMTGQMGVEKTLDSVLKGKNGSLKYLSDRSGLMLPNPDEVIDEPENGKNVFLTIDQKIQTFLEDALNQVVEEYEPEKVIAIVADPKTGEILAMGNRPSFNPNLRDINNYNNDAIAYRFEPGSTMKVFTLAAAIEEGVFNPNETYQSGSYKVPNVPRPIRDHNRTGWGPITYLEGVQRSSNVAFAKIANEKLGGERLLQYMERFGLNQKTGIDLPGEVDSNILYNYQIEMITTSFGQGSTITPIQQIQAATAIANDGKMMKPYVIKRIEDPDLGKVIKEKQPEVVEEPISSDTAKQVRDILETVVTSPKGTGKPYKMEGYSIAGKTGTAQIPNPDGKGYQYGHGNYIFSFIGMAPKDDPRLLMYVAVKKPKLEPYELGSEPTSLIFKTVMKNSLQYLNIEPTEEKETASTPDEMQGIKVKEYEGESVEEAVKALEGEGLEVIVAGDGDTVKSQSAKSGTYLLEGEKVVFHTGGKVTMPDMAGWSVRDVLKFSNVLHLKPNVTGEGYVKKQNISPGTEVRSGDYLIVECEPPNAPEEKKDEEDDEQAVVLD